MLLDLPEVPLPDWAAGVRLLGPITSEALLAGLYDGLRLATIILCVGAANSVANPKRLLASVPPALYEIGTALVVAVTIFPQLADSARRVHAAQALRGGATSGVGRLRRFLVPVLEDALERSLALAAGMDTRGYGRSGGASAARALGDGLAAAPRPDRHLRRHLRLARPDGPARAGPADAGRRRARRGARPGQRRAPRPAHPLPPRPVAYAGDRHRRRRDRGRGPGVVRRPHAGPRRLPGSRGDAVPLAAGAGRGRPRHRARLHDAGPGQRPRPRWRRPHEVGDRAAGHRLPLRRAPGAPPRRPHPRGGRAGPRRRPHRRREVHPPRRAHRARPALHRRGAHWRRPARRGEHRRAAAAGAGAPRRLRRPGPARRVRHRHGRGGAGLRHGAARHGPRDDAPPGRGDARPARHRRPPRPRPAQPVRRPAAAGGHRVGAHHAPARAGARRTHLGPRPDGGRGRPRHDHPPRPRPRPDRAPGRAPARARRAVRRPDRARHRRGRPPRRRPPHGPRRLAGRAAAGRPRPPRPVGAPAPHGARRPPPRPLVARAARARAGRRTRDGAAARRPRHHRRPRRPRRRARRRPHPVEPGGSPSSWAATARASRA